MSQHGRCRQEASECLGITFQQVQKYENGTNRISASRLQQAAHILQVPVPFFFEGAPGRINSDGSAPLPAYVSEFVSSSEGLRLIGAFIRIDKVRCVAGSLALVQELAGYDGDSD